MQSFTFSSREDARQYAGQLLAVVTCTMSEESFLNVIRELSKALDSEVSFMKNNKCDLIVFFARPYVVTVLQKACNDYKILIIMLHKCDSII